MNDVYEDLAKAKGNKQENKIIVQTKTVFLFVGMAVLIAVGLFFTFINGLSN